MHPPITQAVIEVRVAHEMVIEDIEKIAKKLHKFYPHKLTLNDYDIIITPQPIVEESVAVKSHQPRFELASDDQVDKAIISKNTIAVVRLAPYLGWDALYSQFVTAWKSWKRIATTKAITRIGVRYINRIDIPLNNENKLEIEDYLTFYPKVPELGHQPMSEFQISITKPIYDSPWTARIISTALPSPLINHISLLLDTDIFRTEGLPLKDEDLWAMITEARDIKNTVFHSCLTQKTKELFS